MPPQLPIDVCNPKRYNTPHDQILDRLDASMSPVDMNLPAYKLHKLIGQEDGVWSVWVNGNWRVTFQFEGDDAILIDYRDYH